MKLFALCIIKKTTRIKNHSNQFPLLLVALKEYNTMRNDIITEKGDRMVRGLRQYVHGLSNDHVGWTSNQCHNYLIAQGWRIEHEQESNLTIRIHIHPLYQDVYVQVNDTLAISREESKKTSPSFKVIEDPAVLHALNLHTESIKLLKSLGVISNQKDFTSQFGEYLIAKWKGGKTADSGNQKDWDIQFSDGSKAQVKSHAKSPTTTAEFSDFKYDEHAEFDMFYIVVFNHEYTNMCIYEMTKEDALKHKGNGTLLWSRVKKHIKYDGPIQ